MFIVIQKSKNYNNKKYIRILRNYVQKIVPKMLIDLKITSVI